MKSMGSTKIFQLLLLLFLFSTTLGGTRIQIPATGTHGVGEGGVSLADNGELNSTFDGSHHMQAPIEEQLMGSRRVTSSNVSISDSGDLNRPVVFESPSGVNLDPGRLNGPGDPTSPSAFGHDEIICPGPAPYNLSYGTAGMDVSATTFKGCISCLQLVVHCL
nr:uncharacterized protein LOC109193912 isoform X1 [Ipomoea batatas]